MMQSVLSIKTQKEILELVFTILGTAENLRSCEEISGIFIRRYPGEIPASPVRSKAVALCNEAAEPEVPRIPQ